jgi:hypothetical protein
MACLNCKKECGENKYCSGECYYNDAGFTYKPPIKHRYELKMHYPPPMCDQGQGGNMLLYDNKNQCFV